MTRTWLVLPALALFLSACGGTANPSAAPAVTVTATVTAGSSPIASPSEATPTPSVDCDTADQATWMQYCSTDAPEDGETPPAILPWAGGKYTFANGVTITTKVERVEPWGETSDFCDSCLHLKPNDTRFVLRYTIAVPKSVASLDVSLCSGTLSVDNGNDDLAWTGVSGDYSHELDGKIFGGHTKYGTEEYGIKKKYATQTFTWTNSCGDPDGEIGEAGVWGGTIPAQTK